MLLITRSNVESGKSRLSASPNMNLRSTFGYFVAFSLACSIIGREMSTPMKVPLPLHLLMSSRVETPVPHATSRAVGFSGMLTSLNSRFEVRVIVFSI